MADRSRNYLVDFLVVLVLVVVVFAGYKFIPAYMDHHAFRKEVRSKVVSARRNDNLTLLQNDVRRIAGEQGLVLADDGVQATKEGQLLQVRVEYVRPIAIPLSNKDLALRFVINETKDFASF